MPDDAREIADEAAPRLARIAVACGDVAEAVFPSHFDLQSRAKLALKLVDLVRAIEGRVDVSGLVRARLLRIASSTELSGSDQNLLLKPSDAEAILTALYPGPSPERPDAR